MVKHNWFLLLTGDSLNLIKLLFVLILCGIFTNNYAQITSAKTGNWTDPATWVGGIVPDSTSNVIIAASHTVTIDGESFCKDISFGGSTSKIIMNANINCYGNFNRADTSTNYFTSWTLGAKFKFTGYAATQTITKLYTTTTSPYPFSMNEIVIDKKSGKFITSTSGGGYILSIGTSLEIVNGTFELDSTDNIEGRNIANTATNPTITVDAGAVFNMRGGASRIRSGNYIGEETEKIGLLTIYGSFYLACGTSNKASFNNVSIENGGLLYITSGRGGVAGSFNPGTLAVKNGGTLYNSTTTNVWYTNTTTPTILDLQNGGTFLSYSSTTPFPPNINNNGIVRYASSSLDQTIADVNYYRLELSYSGTGYNKNWTLAANRLISDSLEINNSAILVLSASAADTLTINNCVRLTSGSINNSNSNISVILGNGSEISRATGVFTNAPIFSSKVNLKYTSSTSVTSGVEMPAGTSVINNLTMLGSGGITLGSSITVNGILTLTSGLINTTSSTILTLGAAATVSGGNITSFVNGPLSVTGRNSIPMVAPVGKGAAYRPLTSTLIISSGSGVFTVEQIELAPSGTIIPKNVQNISGKRYFHITEVGNIVGTATIHLTFGSDDGVRVPSELTVVAGTNGVQWIAENNSGGYAGDTSSGTIATNYQAASSIYNADFTIGSYINNPLPVNLTAFNAALSNGKMKISWQTAVETGNNGFDVERLSDKSNWVTLAFIQGQGNSNSVKSYSYLDNSISKPGKYYYRLKQINNNGGFQYSNLAEADFVLPVIFSLHQNYPNPFNPNSIISYSLPTATNVKITVFNEIGEKIQVLENGFKTAGNYSVSFNGSNIPTGVYFYRIDAGNFSQVKKMIMEK